MQFLRRLSLLDYALFLAIIVAGALAVMNQRSATGTSSGTSGFALSNQNIEAFRSAVQALFSALATGDPADTQFTAVTAAVTSARDPALAAAITELGAAHATGNDAGIAASLRTIKGLIETSPFAESFLSAYASGTLNHALNSGTATPSAGHEWVHLVWVETAATDAFVDWQMATGEATWTVEPDNSAVSVTFTVPGEGYSGTVRLAPAGPGALVAATATFSAALAESIVALGDPVPANQGILILDLGEATDARPGQPWTGETRLGEPPSLLDDIRRAEAIAWTASIPNGRTFVMRIKMGDTGRAAIAAVFPA
jgi:uncharacterized membrane protein